MDLKVIKNLLDLIAESEVNEVSIEEGDFKIKVKKEPDVEHAPVSQVPMQYQIPSNQPQQQPQQVVQSPASKPKDKPDTADQPQEESGDVVKSPIVGTFYRAPSPEDDVFVEVGDSVEKGQTLCIVEAMKIMNEIESEFSGEIKKILVEDAEAVEYDQPLFIIG